MDQEQLINILFTSDFAKICWTAVFSVFSAYLMGWVKDKRNARLRAANAEQTEEAEERDWEMRCLRTESDLEALDAYAERLGDKARNAVNSLQDQIPLIVQAIAVVELSAQGAPEPVAKTARELATGLGSTLAVIRYIFTDLEVEMKAHQKERPKYLQRLNTRPGPHYPAPLPPPEPEEPTNDN